MARSGSGKNGLHGGDPAHGDNHDEQENQIHRLVRIGMEHAETGRLAQAEETFRQVLSLAQAQAMPKWEAQALHSLAVVFDRLGKYREAIPLFEESLALFSEQGDLRMEVSTSIFLSNMLTRTGEHERSLPLLQRAWAQADMGLSSGTLPPQEHAYELYGIYRELGRAYRGKGRSLLDQSRGDRSPQRDGGELKEQAQELFSQAHRMYEQAMQLDAIYPGARERSALYQDILNLFLEEGNLAGARSFGEDALKALDPTDADDLQVLVEVLFQLGIICLRSGDAANSLHFSMQSYEYFQRDRASDSALAGQEADLAFLGRTLVNIGSAHGQMASGFENIVVALAYWRCGEALLDQAGAPDVSIPRKNIAGVHQLCDEHFGSGLFDHMLKESEPLYQQIQSGILPQADERESLQRSGKRSAPYFRIASPSKKAGRPWADADVERILNDMLEPYHRECARLLRLGERAYARKNYQLAKRHFTAAMHEDPMDLSPACLWLGLACLHLGELSEAIEAFGLDLEIRGDAVTSILLYEWCQMSQQPSAAAYVEWQREEIAELEENEDPLDLLERMAEDHKPELASEIFAAAMLFMRGRWRACLDALAEAENRWGQGDLPWLSHFWKGMAHAMLMQGEQAQSAFQQALAGGMPILLLGPVRWLDSAKTPFVASLVSSYELPPLKAPVARSPHEQVAGLLDDEAVRAFLSREPLPPALEEGEMSPYDRLKYEMRGVDAARDEMVRRGIEALEQKQYARAEQFFRRAVQADMLDESEACYYLALTCLRLLDFNEASYLFYVDAQDREAEAPLSWLLSEWCSLCASSSLAEYWASVRYEMEDAADPLAYRQELYDSDYGNYDDPSIQAFADAFFAYLRGEYQACLDQLEDIELLEESEPAFLVLPTWFVPFWRAMALASLGESDEANFLLQEALAEDIPALLLLPLRWFEQSQPEFYERTVSSIFTRLDLWKQVAARNERERLQREERRQHLQWRIDHIEEDFPGFAQVFQELDAMRARGRAEKQANGWECRYLAEPEDGEAFARTYAEIAEEHQQLSGASTLPVFLAEIPPPCSPRPVTYLVSMLLEQIGDPRAHHRGSEAQKRARLVRHLEERQVELVILTSIEDLTTPAGTKLLLGEIEWLRRLFVDELGNIPLLLVGDASVLEHICAANADFGRTLKPLLSSG